MPSGGWNKREEWNWRDLIKENKTILTKLAKHVRIKIKEFDDATLDEIFSDPKRAKLFFKALDIGTAICLKGMPTKIEGDGIMPEVIIQIDNENKTPQDAGRSISRYIEV